MSLPSTPPAIPVAAGHQQERPDRGKEDTASLQGTGGSHGADGASGRDARKGRR